MSTSKKVVVVGAGIGGLTAALALLERGIDVEVYEQSGELREVGAGIQISSNGTRVLFALGLEAALAEVRRHRDCDLIAATPARLRGPGAIGHSGRDVLSLGSMRGRT